MSDYLEAVGPVRIEPFDYGDAPDWLTVTFDENIDSEGAAWGDDIDLTAETYRRAIHAVVSDYEEVAEALRDFGTAIA